MRKYYHLHMKRIFIFCIQNELTSTLTLNIGVMFSCQFIIKDKRTQSKSQFADFKSRNKKKLILMNARPGGSIYPNCTPRVGEANNR